MNDTSRSADPVSVPVRAARRYAALAEAALVDLEERVPRGIGPLERALAERIRAALARLLECAEQLAADGLIVRGSTGQERPNQFLKIEQELRREVDDALQKLVFRVEQGAMFAQAQALTRKAREQS
jgi:hypothetical protein